MGGVTIVPRTHGLSVFSAITQPTARSLAALHLSGARATYPCLAAILALHSLEKALRECCEAGGPPKRLLAPALLGAHGAGAAEARKGVPSALVHSESWCARISEDESGAGAWGAHKEGAPPPPAWGFSWGIPSAAPAAGAAATEGAPAQAPPRAPPPSPAGSAPGSAHPTV